MSDEQQLSKEVVDYIENMNSQLNAERTKSTNLNTQLQQTSFGAGMSRDQNVIELQLDIQKMKDEIYHLLSGHEVKINPNSKNEYWAEPDDDRLKTFSNFGIKQIMNIFSMHVNINTLMSYYDQETINWKVKDFGIELSDLFLNKYELLLHYPSPEELYEKYGPVVKRKNLDISDEALYNKCIQWSEAELSSKENLLPIICWSIINMVHSAYNRALQGRERTSLGERGINISQSNLNNEPLPSQKKPGFLGIFKG